MLSDPLLVGIATGVVFTVGYVVAKRTLLLAVPRGASKLRLVGGFTLALLAGWIAGVLTAMLVYELLTPVLQYSFSADQLFLPLIGKSLLFAGMGAGHATWYLRKQATQAPISASQVRKKGSEPVSTNNKSYAEALAEIDEGRLDKGAWARAYAESGGDELKAKAAYIKSRAASIQSAAEWSNTRPPDDAPSGKPLVNVPNGSTPKAGNFHVTPEWVISVVVVVAFVAMVGMTINKNSKRPQEIPVKFGENDKVVPPLPLADMSQFEPVSNVVQTGPDWDKGVITPPAKPSAQDLYVKKVRAIQEKVKRGELAPVDGIASLEPPKNLVQWPNAESVKLEQSQTWWRNGSNQFNIHVQNTTPYQLTTLALDFGQQGCESAVGKRTFYVALRQIVTSGSQALLSFTPPISISNTPNNCLVVSSAWQPVNAIPAQAQPARLAPVANAESAKERTDSKQVQADLDAVVKRAIEDYPFLDTQEGQPVLAKIVERRDEFIRKGVYPSIALTRAINDFAPAFVPREMQVRKGPPVVESGDKGNHPGFDPKCRWVTPQEWSCK